MNYANYNDKSASNPVNNMLIDKPQLKPIDLLVDRPVDPNAGRNTNRPTQPIVERIEEKATPVEARILNENILKQTSKERPASNVLASREQQIEKANINKERVIGRREAEPIDHFSGISHLLDELDNPNVVAKIKHIINESGSGSTKGIFDKELELENKTLREQNRTLNEQSLSLIEKSRSLSEENHILTEQNRKLKEENRLVKEQFETSSVEVKKLKKIAINLKEEKKDFKNKTETLFTEHKKLFTKVQRFEYDQKMFTLFTMMKPDVKQSLRGIFKADTYENFIACGCQRYNIDSLWDFAKNRVQKQQFDEIETINQILLYFIDIFNQTSSSPTIKIQEVAIGTNFDTDAHIKSSDSIKPAGIINKIYLIGYQNVSNDKILNKAIVLIGG